jgi:D-inositol-3-phosphate glycosyltransferase
MKTRHPKRKASSRPVKARQTRGKPRKAAARTTPRKKAKAKPAAAKKKALVKKAATRKQAAKAVKKAPVRKKTVARKASSRNKPKPASKPVVRKTVPAAKKTVPVKKTIPVKKAAISKTQSVVAAPQMSTMSFAVMASGTPLNSANASVQGLVRHRVTCGIAAHVRTRKPRLLWIGDALVPTGFATVTHAVLNHLRRDWDVVVSGINYNGAAHNLPYHVMPAWQGGDMWGMNRFTHLCAEFDPAAVIINNDWWNVAKFAMMAPKGVPVVGYMPVDGGNLDPADMQALNRLHAAVWYTNYGHREAVKTGFKGARHVIPHGIDTTLFQPMNRDEARRLLDLNVPKNAFIIGNLNRNQPRKRLDLTIQIFADWIKRNSVSNAFLLLHCAQKDTGWNLRRVAAFHGVADRLLLTGSDDIRELQGTHHLNLIYNSLDVQMSTTLGEGWGLTTMEGMACGIPQIVPDSSALAEWAVAAVKVPCSRVLMNPEINTTGALVDHEPFVIALQSLYQNGTQRRRLAARGLALVRANQFRWSAVAKRFSSILSSTLLKRSKSLRS